MGEARCQPCHAAIFQDSLTNRHTQTYYRGAQVLGLPRPDRPLADPTDPKVTHAIKEVDGALWEETRVGDTVLRSLIEYAFGTSERYLTMVSRDAQDQYRLARLSYYHTADGQGWDRTSLGCRRSDPSPRTSRAKKSAYGLGLAVACIATLTYPRSGRERIGPETADRAIGCERCHGPGGNHLAAVAAGFSDRAIVNPASASPQAVTQKQCNKCHILDRALPARRSRKTRLGPLARCGLDLEPVQYRERRRVRLRHLPRPPQGAPVDHDRPVRGQMPRLPLGRNSSVRRRPRDRLRSPRPSRDRGSALSIQRKGASNATCPACGWTHRTEK